MRWCLACRHFSGEGPICTSCGRSFGGRLCNSKKRHLSPPDARVCGQCGSTNLLEAASYVPFGCLGRLLVWGSLLLLLRLAIGVLGWAGSLLWGMAGYRSPLVWLVEGCARLLIVFFVFYLLSAFLPGEAGKMFRGFITNLASQILKHGFGVLQKAVVAVFNGLAAFVGGTKTKP